MVKKIAASAKKIAGTSGSAVSGAKAAPLKAAPAKALATKTAPVKAAPVKAAQVKTAPVTTTAAKAPAAKAAPVQAAPAKAAPAKTPPATTPPAKTPAAKTSAVTATPNHSKQSPMKDAVKQAAKASAPAKKATPPVEPPEAVAPKRPTATARKAAAPAVPAPTLPPVKGETKDGIKFTKDFDAKFLAVQRALLLEARESLTGQAVRLEDEANSLIDDEMGDVQFDDESGEGDTMVVERERDLFLSARARQDIEQIDDALRRLEIGSYGYSVVSFRPIPRERLEAIPWATELTEEKVGGIGRR
jgi:RNA polymerase-binding transcription factor DksA